MISNTFIIMNSNSELPDPVQVDSRCRRRVYETGVMLSSNFAIHVQHSYSSKWWQWPLMCGKMTYLWVEQNKQLWCIGNPIVWYSGLIGIITWVISSFFKFDVRVNLWVFFGYMISYLPFSLIKRVMWNYHYFY